MNAYNMNSNKDFKTILTEFKYCENVSKPTFNMYSLVKSYKSLTGRTCVIKYSECNLRDTL